MLHLDEMDHWRGVAQAALLLGTLDHEAEAPRLIELFVATSSEVRLAAAVGLRRLAVDETLPQIFAMTDLICQGIKIDMYNRLLTDGRAQGNPKSIDDHVRAAVKDVLTDTLAKQVAQSMQMFGQMRYRKAEPLMRLHIPKHSYPVVQRAAAIWALGHLYDGAVNEDLSAKFAGRLSDINPMDPEALPVRRFSAVGIGRMKTTSQTAVLDRFYHEDSYSADVGGACRWALMHLDGQQRPPLSPIYTRQGGYFLEPDDELEDDQYLEVAR
jgi:hypothetical protein